MSTATVELALLKTLYRYWSDKRRGRAMPSRSDIDLLELPGLLPKLMLLDALGGTDGPRFRYSMLGSDLVARLGRDPTGRFVDEALEGAHRQFMLGLYAEAWQSKGPAMAESQYLSENQVAFSCRRLVMPLSNDGQTVSHLLGLQVFLPERLRVTKLQFGDPSIRNVRLGNSAA